MGLNFHRAAPPVKGSHQIDPAQLSFLSQTLPLWLDDLAVLFLEILANSGPFGMCMRLPSPQRTISATLGTLVSAYDFLQ